MIEKRIAKGRYEYLANYTFQDTEWEKEPGAPVETNGKRIYYVDFQRDCLRIPVPDTTQQTDSTCGASCLQAVCGYFGVGPHFEWEFARDLGTSREYGTNPHQMKRTARSYGLTCKEYTRDMTVDSLKAEIREGHPVLLPIQAWRYSEHYQDRWDDGHWVVAIGFNDKGILFEDPSIQVCRGWLTNEDLDRRWHDKDGSDQTYEHYGLALWLDFDWTGRRSAYSSRAAKIP